MVSVLQVGHFGPMNPCCKYAEKNRAAESVPRLQTPENSLAVGAELVDTVDELMERTQSLERRLASLEAAAAYWNRARTSTTSTTTPAPVTVHYSLRVSTGFYLVLLGFTWFY